ncbi:hypothetical protein BJV77DRAFT_723412 [Russula vinacea]|nr:hypothetical protein BJV77DRAFT_723412 [Russula vinacea]
MEATSLFYIPHKIQLGPKLAFVIWSAEKRPPSGSHLGRLPHANTSTRGDDESSRHASPGRDAATQPGSIHSSILNSTDLRCSRSPSTSNTTVIVQQDCSGIATRGMYSGPPPRKRQPQRLSMTLALLTPAGGPIIPHDEAFASARLHHRPTFLLAETTLAPARPDVRLRCVSNVVLRD